MNNVNFLKPNKENLNLYLVLGALFFTLGIVEIIFIKQILLVFYLVI
jgi:hypothetical protein